MGTPLEQIRAQLARHDVDIVRTLVCRAVQGAAPVAFYAPGWAAPIFHALPLGVALPPPLMSFTTQIETGFVAQVLPLLAPAAAVPAVDNNAIAEADAATLAAIAFRLGLSLQVAESKLSDGRDMHLHTVAETGDTAAVTALITYPSVEQLVLLRVRARASEYVRTHNLTAVLASRLPPAIDTIYRVWLIPLSRAIQAAWLIWAVRHEPANSGT